MKYYDVAIINKSGWFEVVQNVLALSKVDAMHICRNKVRSNRKRCSYFRIGGLAL